MKVQSLLQTFLCTGLNSPKQTLMAYRTISNSNEGLINGLQERGLVKSDRVKKAMLQVDRGYFIKSNPYVDAPVPLGNTGQTISAPHMHAMCLELLEDHLKEGSKVLDVGCGSGYLSACMGCMVGSSGKVIGIDIYPELIKHSKDAIKLCCPDLVSKGVIEIKSGDGWKGDEQNAPFDAIHVGAGAESLPEALVNQLKPGGRLIIPVGPQHLYQELLQVDKRSDGSITQRHITDCRYVPLQKIGTKTSE